MKKGIEKDLEYQKQFVDKLKEFKKKFEKLVEEYGIDQMICIFGKKFGDTDNIITSITVKGDVCENASLLEEQMTSEEKIREIIEHSNKHVIEKQVAKTAFKLQNAGKKVHES